MVVIPTPTPSPSYLFDTLTYLIKRPEKYEKRNFSVSVIFSARDEEENVVECLESLLQQTYKPVQIIAINDGSKDKTGEILDSYSREIKVYHNPSPQGKTLSIRQHLHELQGELTLTADADTLYDINFLDEIRTPFSDSKVAAVCGFVYSRKNKSNSLAEEFVTRARSNEYYLSKYRKEAQSRRDAVYVLSGASTVVRTLALKEVGIPLRNETEDLDFTWTLHELSKKMKKQGYKIKYQPSAKAFTREPKNRRELFEQEGRWYRGAWQNLFQHGREIVKAKFSIPFQVIEGVPLSLVWLSLPAIALYRPEWVLTFLALDFPATYIPTLYHAKKDKKLKEVIQGIPAYYLGMRTLNHAALLYGLGKTLKDWIKGKRKWRH
jgi:biofilm PGA synthesis N-glycosyltransferase PgaC